jgi:hypothetical protein
VQKLPLVAALIFLPDLFDPNARTHGNNPAISRSFRLRIGQRRREAEKVKCGVVFPGALVKALAGIDLIVLVWAFFVGS